MEGGEYNNEAATTIQDFLLDPQEYLVKISPAAKAVVEQGESLEKVKEAGRKQKEENDKREADIKQARESYSQGLIDKIQMDEIRRKKEKEDEEALKLMKLDFEKQLTYINEMIKERNAEPDNDDKVKTMFSSANFYAGIVNGDFAQIENRELIENMVNITFTKQAEEIGAFLGDAVKRKLRNVSDTGDQQVSKYYEERVINRNAERINKGFKSLGHDPQIDSSAYHFKEEYERLLETYKKGVREEAKKSNGDRKELYETQAREYKIEPLVQEERKKQEEEEKN